MRRLFLYILQDWSANRGNNLKIRAALAAFRLAQRAGAAPQWSRLFCTPYLLAYRIFCEWILGIELPWTVVAGPNLRIYHGIALVVHPKSVIGHSCTLRQSTTIGARPNRQTRCSEAPHIGNQVDIGANAVLLGPIRVGDGAVIGAGSVVLRDVPPWSVVAGNPAKVIRDVQAQDRRAFE